MQQATSILVKICLVNFDIMHDLMELCNSVPSHIYY